MVLHVLQLKQDGRHIVTERVIEMCGFICPLAGLNLLYLIFNLCDGARFEVKSHDFYSSVKLILYKWYSS